jgi:hypothetical protein
MPNPLFGDCPYDPGNAGLSRGIEVQTVTLHRTIGSWRGDYSVGKTRDHNSGTFQFLIGQSPGQWVQFYPVNTFCSHAAGSNNVGPGLELSGQNGEPLTDWQIEALGRVMRWLRDDWGIAPTFRKGDPRTWYDRTGPSGFVCHNSVAYPPDTSYHHHDYITADEFARAMGQPAEDDEMKPELFAEASGKVWIYNGALGTKTWVRDPDSLSAIQTHWALQGVDGTIKQNDLTRRLLAAARDVDSFAAGGVGAATTCQFVPAPTQFNAA